MQIWALKVFSSVHVCEPDACVHMVSTQPGYKLECRCVVTVTEIEGHV